MMEQEEHIVSCNSCNWLWSIYKIFKTNTNAKGSRTWELAFKLAVGAEQPLSFEIHKDGTGFKDNPIVRNNHNDVLHFGAVHISYIMSF